MFLKHVLMNQAGGDGAPAGGGNGGNGDGGNGQPASWYGGFEPDLKGYVETKGFKDPKDLTIAYRNLEKLQGVPADQLLRMPKADDADGMGKLYDRLGRPAKPEDYGIKAPDGDSGEFAKAASAKFHELGLNAKQAQALIGWYAEFGGAQSAAASAKLAETQKADAAALQKEWGAAYEKKLSVVDGVADAFEMDEQQLVALRKAMGPAGALRFMAKIGERLGEDSFVSGDKPVKGALTPDGAKTRIKELMKDQTFQADLTANKVEAKKLWDDLHTWAYPTQAA